MFARSLTFLVLLASVSAGAATKTCSWVGSDDSCRDQEVGTVCARDGKEGVCAVTYWDHCGCVAAEGARRRSRFEPSKAPIEKKTCSWVGTHSACREQAVGSLCSTDGRAGVCAPTYWDHCDCVPRK